MATDLPLRARQLYRALLRELPRRHISLSSSTPPSNTLKQRFRTQFEQSSSPTLTSIQQAEQFVQYAKAQRMYATLVARYNPGMDMDQEERVRLTARRVGMDLPVENDFGASNKEEEEILENTRDGERVDRKD
ncbi:hypothetical protein TCE0_033f08653 [Talaromyces pinophilus]|uniref:Uncharacterized protein n=1 Tax=Talaromyces pinophilus TaxID=128442 RepID=A0A6V8HAN4_TALPI|nr:hypothetical protein TCE0_033f08653 [Talaromyces pinophilus]